MIKTSCYFYLEGLEVDVGLLGKTLSATPEPGFLISFTLPSGINDPAFRNWLIDESPVAGYVETNGKVQRERIRIILGSVESPEDFVAADFDGDPLPMDLYDEGFRAATRNANLIREALLALLNHLRVSHRQYWLGLSGKPPELAAGPTTVDRLGERIPVGVSLKPLTVHLGVSPVHEDQFAHALELAAAGSQPPVAESLLADAKFLNSEQGSPQYREAILLAAIACETRIKDAMLDCASEVQRPLVEALLQNPRDWSMAAAGLFDKGLKAVGGRSLREEDKALHKRVAALFEDRNKIAHGTKSVAPSSAPPHIQTASAVFAWLDAVIKGADHGD